MVYAPDTHIKKNVDLIIKPLLVTKPDQIVITIDINKSIDSLKKIIFDRLGEQIGSYYNIKLYVTNPILTELNVTSKTIAQCGLKDYAKVVVEGKYAFGFCDVPAELVESLALSNGSNTVNRLKVKKVESPKKQQSQ